MGRARPLPMTGGARNPSDFCMRRRSPRVRRNAHHGPPRRPDLRPHRLGSTRMFCLGRPRAVGRDPQPRWPQHHGGDGGKVACPRLPDIAFRWLASAPRYVASSLRRLDACGNRGSRREPIPEDFGGNVIRPRDHASPSHGLRHPRPCARRALSALLDSFFGGSHDVLAGPGCSRSGAHHIQVATGRLGGGRPLFRPPQG